MKTLHLVIILAISLPFIGGMGFTMLALSHMPNQSSQVVTTNNVTMSSSNGSSFVVVNSITNRIYVTNEVGHTISVIDGNDNEKIVDMPVDEMPYRLAVNPNTNRIYVLEIPKFNNPEQNNTLLTIDGTSNTKVGELLVGPYSQMAVNPNTDRIYLSESHGVNGIVQNSNAQNSTVNVLDGNNDSKITSIAIGGVVTGMAVNPVTNKIYVIHRHEGYLGINGTVTVIDGNNNTKIREIQVGLQPTGIAVNSVTNRVYVTNYRSGTMSVIDGNNDIMLGKPHFLNFSVEGIAVNLITNKIYVAAGTISTLYVIDGNTGNKIAGISVSGWSVDVNPTTNRIYMPDYSFNNISVIDGKYNNIMKVIQIGKYPDNLNLK